MTYISNHQKDTLLKTVAILSDYELDALTENEYFQLLPILMIAAQRGLANLHMKERK